MDASQVLTEARQCWLLVLLTAFTFFFLLGSRGLNEPDEGRYAVVAHEMLERNDWVVPHFWYAPHLDKPPLTYWAVASAMKWFGINEWAIRLPLALAGISGVWAVYCLGWAMAGRRAGFWASVILQSSLLYWVMARMLTTDIFLTQFVAWAVYFFWKTMEVSLGSERAGSRSGGSPNVSMAGWALAGWLMLALGFLTKGPVAIVVALAPIAAVVVFERRRMAHWRGFGAAMAIGALFFLVAAAPWFVLVFNRVPGASDYMVLGQAIGHAFGTTITNRKGSPLYYLGILIIGFLPWTALLAWGWRRSHWRSLDDRGKRAWVLLSSWGLFSLLLFSCFRAKLPAYILPGFPALALLVSLRLHGGERSEEADTPPAWAIRSVWMSSWIPLLLFAVAVPLVFHARLPIWFNTITGVTGGLMAAGMVLLDRGSLSKAWHGAAPAVAIWSLMWVAAGIPSVQLELKSNLTLKPLGAALRSAYQPGDAMLCWGRLPQGLPIHAWPIINSENRPFLAGLPLNQVPFEFPGNKERFGKLLLKDDAAVKDFFSAHRRVLIVAMEGSVPRLEAFLADRSLKKISEAGQWQLWSSDVLPRQTSGG